MRGRPQSLENVGRIRGRSEDIAKTHGRSSVFSHRHSVYDSTKLSVEDSLIAFIVDVYVEFLSLLNEHERRHNQTPGLKFRYLKFQVTLSYDDCNFVLTKSCSLSTTTTAAKFEIWAF